MLQTACKKRPDCCNTISANESPIHYSDLKGKWLFNYFVNQRGMKEKQPKDFKQMNVTFIDSFIVYKGERNTGDGIYSLYSENRIRVKEPGMFSTMVGGNIDAMEWEEKFYNVLNMVSCYQIKREILILTYQENGKCKAMYFTKE